MKKTQIIELFKNIKSTIMSFIAIVAFAALGIALFTGVSWSADSFLASANNQLETANLYDIEVSYLYGFDQTDIEKFKLIEGVDEVEGFKSDYAFIDLDGKKEQLKISQIGETINLFSEVYGVAPSATNEIAFDKTYADSKGIKIGSTVEFLPSTGTTLSSGFVNTEYTVTALVVSPLFIGKSPTTYGVASNKIPIDGLAFLPKNAFKPSLVYEFNTVSIRSDSLRGISTFSKDYIKANNNFLGSIESQIQQIVDQRYTAICTKLHATAPEYEKVITQRMYNAGIVALQISGNSFYNTRFSMCAVFVVVGLFVTVFVIIRLVHDQSIRIGTKRALGTPLKSIVGSYLSYSGLAVLIGGILSIIISLFIIEPTLFNGTGKSFALGSPKIFFSPGLFAICFGVELVLILLATLFACRNIWKKTTMSFLKGDEENHGKARKFEKTKLWQKTPLFYKTIINNCLNNKKRVLATIISIAGCASLIVCGVATNSNIQNSFNRQYSDIFLFDNIAYYIEDSQDDVDSGEAIKLALNNKGITNASLLENTVAGVIMPDGQQVFAQVFVPLEDQNDFLSIKPQGKANSATNEGVWMNVSYANEYNAKPGDDLHIIDLEGTPRTLTISGFYENYLTKHQLIISPDAYAEEFKKAPVANSVAFSMGNQDIKELESELSSINGFVSINRYKENSRKFFDSFTNIAMVLTTIYLVMSIAVAFLILLNLFVMLVSEKKKESIVMMINGYTRKQIKTYLSRDSFFLSILGILVGIGAGTLMAALSIHSFESGMAFFIKGFNWLACLIGVAGTAILTFVMMQIALHRIDKLKLSDINKA